MSGYEALHLANSCQVKQNDSWFKQNRGEGDMSCKEYTQAIKDQTKNGK